MPWCPESIQKAIEVRDPFAGKTRFNDIQGGATPPFRMGAYTDGGGVCYGANISASLSVGVNAS